VSSGSISRQQKKLNTPGQRSRQGRGVNPGRSLPCREEAVNNEFVSLFGCLFELRAAPASLTLGCSMSILAMLFRAPGIALA
jgi:hypothetical protein